MRAIYPFSSASALAAGLVMLLAACASEPSGTTLGKDSTGGALPPPSPGEPAAIGESAPPPALPEPRSTSVPPAEPAEGEPIIVEGPEGTTWQAPAAENEEVYQADLEDCYRYAVGQTQRDAQHITDRNAGIDTLTNESPWSGLRQRVDEYDLRNRRTALMSSCMESKGYARADTVLPRLEF